MLKKIINKIEVLAKTNRMFNIEAYLEERKEKNGRFPALDNKYHLKRQ